MIIGRNNELNQLATYYERDRSQIVVLYGQKYIGKTAILKEFMAIMILKFILILF